MDSHSSQLVSGRNGGLGTGGESREGIPAADRSRLGRGLGARRDSRTSNARGALSQALTAVVKAAATVAVAAVITLAIARFGTRGALG
ncbi:MAG: hypothetical protein HOP29_05010, partial [Phycisphaerales bacterium]|nr:hypothetical protein [Phycisphaerales bacterium]